MNKKGKGKFIWGVFLFLFLIVLIFELILVAYAYVNADEVECNLLWCTFKSANTDVVQTLKCKMNNQTINCSEIDNSTLNKMYEEMLNQLPQLPEK